MEVLEAKPALAGLIIFFLFLSLLTSCSTDEKTPALNPAAVYKRDMILNVDGVIGEGVLVVPQKDVHKLHITAQGDLDLFTFTTCHREETAENASNVTETTGIFRRKIERKKEIKMDYRPTAIERSGGCPIYLGGYEQEKGRHSWGLVDFETPEATLPATVYCNGKEVEAKGVSICQSRNGLIQAIKFKTPVKVSPDPACDLGKKEGDYFQFAIKKGQCVYAFMDADKNFHRFTTIGYELIPIRK